MALPDVSSNDMIFPEPHQLFGNHTKRSKRIFTRLSMSNEIPFSSVGSPQLLGWISRSDPLKERRAKQLNSLRHSIPDHPNPHLIIIMYLFDTNTKTISTTTSTCKTIKLADEDGYSVLVSDLFLSL